MNKIVVEYHSAQKNDDGNYDVLVSSSVESNGINWVGELTVQLVDGEFDCSCQIFSYDISHDECLWSNYSDTNELGHFDEEFIDGFFQKIVDEAEQGFSEEYSFEYFLEESSGLRLNDSSTSAAGCGIVGGIHLEKYTEIEGTRVLLVAIDSEANSEKMINRTKKFDSEEDYDDYVEECSEINGRQLFWNDGCFALQMYKKMVDREYW